MVLQLYFSPEFSLQRAFYILTVLAATYPLFQLHLNQRREPHQPRETAWLRSIFELLVNVFDSTHEHLYFLPDLTAGLGKRLFQDLQQLYHLLGIDDPSAKLFPTEHIILATPRWDCIFCANEGHPPTLRRRRKPQQVRLLDSGFRWTQAELFVAYCPKCDAEYYPDRITYRVDTTLLGCMQRLEYDARYLHVSKHGVWMDRRVALARENAILRFRSGWTNFAEWLSDTINSGPRVTTRQSQRLYFEHFARRLISSHGLEDTITVPAHSSAHALAESVRAVVGKDGGVVAGSMDHACTNCTHLKCYHADLVAEGIEMLDDTDPMVQEIPAGLPTRPKQQARVHGSKRGYACMAVGDGKTITHKKCAITVCRKPLVNYKNGRFCINHLDMREKCGIIPCGHPIHSSGAPFPGVQHVIRRQNEATGSQTGPTLHAELPQLGDVAGKDVVHTFHAGTTYCLQTFQWACGCPIGWGKCYGGEGSSQVLQIMDNIWQSDPDSRPSFLAYDNACNLFRHIVTQNPNSPWIRSTKFIVDAWHYIGHSAVDILCQLWCNPAPTNGSQPDLISVRVDDNGRTHTTRAFNTETAEQLNAWLNGYEAQLRQMTDINYDFCVHVLMLLYKDLVDARVVKKDKGLTEEFWEKVDSTE
ncbi:hypothetical protein C8R43DRAFT_1092719 [Mycena crocata]|nr:hypothetical protein C8R43DRAFT_1092719 [Mycena crocata]